MSNLLSNFPERLRQLRTAKALTQSELADALGVSRNSIFFYESAQRTPDIIVLKKIADYFGVTCDYMIGASINRSEETRNIGDELGLTDEAIAALKQQTQDAKHDFDARMRITGINKIICNKQLIFEIASYIDPNYKAIFADFITRDFADIETENSKKQTFSDIGIPYTEENRRSISEFLCASLDGQIISHIQNELDKMRGDNSTNADKKD